MQRTLKRESKVLEIVKRETIVTGSPWPPDTQSVGEKRLPSFGSRQTPFQTQSGRGGAGPQSPLLFLRPPAIRSSPAAVGALVSCGTDQHRFGERGRRPHRGKVAGASRRPRYSLRPGNAAPRGPRESFSTFHSARPRWRGNPSPGATAGRGQGGKKNTARARSRSGGAASG